MATADNIAENCKARQLLGYSQSALLNDGQLAIVAAVQELIDASWQIVGYGDGDSLVIHYDEDNRVCFMATHGGSRAAWERIQAQAKLICAAPPLVSAVTQAARWFEEYAVEHYAKARTADSYREQGAREDKGRRNQDRADFLRAALNLAKAEA